MEQITISLAIVLLTAITLLSNYRIFMKYEKSKQEDEATIKALNSQIEELKNANINLHNSRSDLYNLIKENGLKMPLGKRKP